MEDVSNGVIDAVVVKDTATTPEEIIASYEGDEATAANEADAATTGVSENIDSAAVPENPDTTGSVPDAPTQKQLTPEEIAKAAEKNAIRQELFNDFGVFALVQFRTEDSVVSRVTFSDRQPFRPTLIAVFEKLVREFKLSEEIDAQQEIMARMVLEEQRQQKEKAEMTKAAKKEGETRELITRGITH